MKLLHALFRRRFRYMTLESAHEEQALRIALQNELVRLSAVLETRLLELEEQFADVALYHGHVYLDKMRQERALLLHSEDEGRRLQRVFAEVGGAPLPLLFRASHHARAAPSKAAPSVLVAEPLAPSSRGFASGPLPSKPGFFLEPKVAELTSMHVPIVLTPEQYEVRKPPPLSPC